MIQDPNFNFFFKAHFFSNFIPCTGGPNMKMKMGTLKETPMRTGVEMVDPLY
jgi:hypothetical protein